MNRVGWIAFGAAVIVSILSGSDADIITTVNVIAPTITAGTGGDVTIPCEYLLDSSTPTQLPIVFWIKGKSVDDPNAIIIYGNRKLNDSYAGKAEVSNGKPYLTLYNVDPTDEGRYWCMVTEWSARTQVGTDADSCALSVDATPVTQPSVFVTTEHSINVTEGYTAIMSCTPSGTSTWDTITWYQGPFQDANDEGYVTNEIGYYEKLGSYYLSPHCDTNGVCSSGQQIEPGYQGIIGITSNVLVIYATVKEDQGRYWCEASNSTASYSEFQTNRDSTILSVISGQFDCAGKPQGVYADPNDCSMYYECVGDPPTQYHRSCGSSSLVFNPDTGTCVWANDVPPPCGTQNEA